MNTTMKMTLVAGALALAVAGQANAAIVAGSTMSNDLVLSVWDATNNTSFTENLGVTMQQLLTSGGLTFGGTAKAPAISGVDTSSYTVADANLASFLATASSATVWTVAAANMGTLGYGTSGVFTTATSAPASPTASALSSMSGMNTAYLGAVNTLIGTGSDVSTNATVGGAAYFGAAGNGMTFGGASNLGGNLSVSNAAAIGASQNLFFITPYQNARNAYAAGSVYEYSNAAGLTSVTLGSNGTLSIAAAAAVAAVPEPGEWLLMLSGLALIGFIATRRKEGSVTFA
jgi:hypothetical protein